MKKRTGTRVSDHHNATSGVWLPSQMHHISSQNAVGVSLVSSRVVSLVLKRPPFDSLWWGVLLLAVGIAVLAIRQ